MSSKYPADVSKDGVLSWTIDIKTTDQKILQNFVEHVSKLKFLTISESNKWICNNKSKIADFKGIKSFNLATTKIGLEYFETIRKFICTESDEPHVEIAVENSYQRLVIYVICIIFGLTCSKVTNTIDVYVPCTVFLPCNKGKPREEHDTKMYDSRYDDIICGCEYAPKSFRRHHHDNNYDDTISYSKFRSKMKVAVRIHKK
jgi:hypothetical protein